MHRLATAGQKQLIKYPGIGPVRARRIIEEARQAINALSVKTLRCIWHTRLVVGAEQTPTLTRYDFQPGLLIIDDLDTLANSVRGPKGYDRLARLVPQLLPLALRTSWCVVGLKQLRVPDASGATTNADLFKKLQPNIRSFE